MSAAPNATPQAIRASILELLARRDAGKTICPSEVARALDAEDWRALMPSVRDVAVMLAREGAIDITQGGVPLDPDAPLRGAIRLRRRS